MPVLALDGIPEENPVTDVIALPENIRKGRSAVEAIPRVHKIDPGPLGKLYGNIHRLINSSVLLRNDPVGNPLFLKALLKGLRYGKRPVRRAPVFYDIFKIGILLRKNRGNCLFDLCLRVIAYRDNRNKRLYFVL